jgi:hypothetical protein
VNPLKRGALPLVLAVLAAAGLAYDAYVHLHLAGNYSHNGDSITQGGLFTLEAVIALVLALAVLLSDNKLVWLGVGITGLGGVAVVVLYRYVDVGAIGPVPNMYEPLWYGEKTASAFVEAGVGVLWLIREGIRYPAVKHSSVSAA